MIPVLPIQYNSLKDDITLTIVTGHITRFAGPYESKSFEIPKDTVNQVAKYLCTLVSHVPLAS